MKILLLILLLAVPALAQKPSRQPVPTTNESIAKLRKIVSQYEAKVKQSAYDLACAKEYAEHGDTLEKRQLLVSVCGGDEPAILPVSDAEYMLKMHWNGLRSAQKTLRYVINNSPSGPNRNKQGRLPR